MAFKPTREFSANVGDYSENTAGPDSIENDIDSINRMFDPLTEHSPGVAGGIAEGNIQAGAATDTIIGERTINQNIADAYTNTGVLSKLLSLFGKVIKAMKGTANWYTTTSDTIEGIHTRVTTNTTNITANATAIAIHKTSGDHDGRYYKKSEIDSTVSTLATKAENALKADAVNVYTKSEINSTVATLTTKAESALKADAVIVYTKSQVDSTVATLATKAENALKADAANVYTKSQLEPYLRGGDTVIRREVFIIVTSNNGDGTFTYTDSGGIEHFGSLGTSGEQIFTLQKGSYALGEERVEAIINDTLQRSVTSGGLTEVDSTHIALASPEGAGAEITIKYFERVSIVGLGIVQIGATQPAVDAIWFKVVG